MRWQVCSLHAELQASGGKLGSEFLPQASVAPSRISHRPPLQLIASGRETCPFSPINMQIIFLKPSLLKFPFLDGKPEN